MNLSEIEKKLATLALDKAAYAGEIDNSAVAFFRELRKRGINAQTFSQNGSTSGANYEPLYQAERMTNVNLRIEMLNLQGDKATLQAEVNRLTAMVNHKQAPMRKAKGELLTEKERMMFNRIANYFGQPSSSTVWRICRTNSDNGVIQGLLKKGFVEKRYNNGLGLTEAGIAYAKAHPATA